MKDFIIYFFAGSLTFTIVLILLNLYSSCFERIKKDNKTQVKYKKKKRPVHRNKVHNTYEKPLYNYVMYEDKKCVGYDGPSLSSRNHFTYKEYSRENIISR